MQHSFSEGKTIQFCGDSFCADVDEISWTYKLAKKLGATNTGKGAGGTAHEHVFKTFSLDTTYTVICWTSADRFYIPDRTYAATPNTVRIFHPNFEFEKSQKNFWNSVVAYYKYIHSSTYARDRQARELYWFDNVGLHNTKSKIVHLFCFVNTYEFSNGYTHNKPLKKIFNTSEPDKNIIYSNHLNEEDNDSLAQLVYDKFTDPLLFS